MDEMFVESPSSHFPFHFENSLSTNVYWIMEFSLNYHAYSWILTKEYEKNRIGVINDVIL